MSDSITRINSLVKAKIAPSKIHGVGLFAIRDLHKGQRLNADIYPVPFRISEGNISKLLPEVRELLISHWPQITYGGAFMYPDTRLQAYINHSDVPNYDCIKDEIVRDIKEGEEITEDYRKIKGWEVAFEWLK